MKAQPDLVAAVTAYVDFYEKLTADDLDRLETLCAPEVRFRDPFNDVSGVGAYRALLAHMFEQVVDPRFAIDDWALSGRIAYMRWDFTFTPRKARTPWHIEGMTEVHFDDQGRVAAHLDHWDSGSQVYGRLPVLRYFIGLIRKRLSVNSQ